MWRNPRSVLRPYIFSHVVWFRWNQTCLISLKSDLSDFVVWFRWNQTCLISLSDFVEIRHEHIPFAGFRIPKHQKSLKSYESSCTKLKWLISLSSLLFSTLGYCPYQSSYRQPRQSQYSSSSTLFWQKKKSQLWCRSICCWLCLAVLVVSLCLDDGKDTNNHPVLEKSLVDAVGPR